MFRELDLTYFLVRWADMSFADDKCQIKKGESLLKFVIRDEFSS